MDNQNGLKYCPFCGWKYVNIHTRTHESYVTNFYIAYCSNCGAMSAEYPSKEKLIAAWNKRATDNLTSDERKKSEVV